MIADFWLILVDSRQKTGVDVAVITPFISKHNSIAMQRNKLILTNDCGFLVDFG